MTQRNPDWNGLADRLDTLSDDLLKVAPDAPDEIESQLVELQGYGLRHLALRLRMYAE